MCRFDSKRSESSRPQVADWELAGERPRGRERARVPKPKPPHSTELSDLNGDRGSLQVQMRLAASSSRPLSHALRAATRRARTPPRNQIQSIGNPAAFPLLRSQGLRPSAERTEGGRQQQPDRQRLLHVSSLSLPPASPFCHSCQPRTLLPSFLPPSVVMRCEFKWTFSPPPPRGKSAAAPIADKRRGGETK